jgi:succinate dehydrogenase / fumarate reductase, cytochrome b subunit
VKNSARLLVRKYSWQYSGMLAWLIQRVSGLLLLFYLFLHVHTINKLSQGPAAFDQAMSFYQNPVFKLLEIALLGNVVLHALNGIRITLIDLGMGREKQRQLFWLLALGIGGLIFLAGAIPIFLFSILRI